MSTTIVNNSTKHELNEFIPCVRYGFSNESEKPSQAAVLRSIYESTPNDAITASPVYHLTHNQCSRQKQLENPYAVIGDSCIATVLQDECEADNRVCYPIHIESDVYHEEGPATLIGWFREFVEDVLSVSFSSCPLYFSGNRSIHVHVPRIVADEDQREHLKDRAEAFCAETDADFDFGLYSRKRQFRLPGIIHEKSTLAKIRIEPEWSHEQIIRAANTGQSTVPSTYAEVLIDVFGSNWNGSVPPAQPATQSVEQLFGADAVLGLPSTTKSDEERHIPVPIPEQETIPKVRAERELWEAYNRKEFSPYAHAGNNQRSVAAVKVVGGAFQRAEVSRNRILVPAYFYGAHGCNGREFTKHKHFAPLQLSEGDFKKWEFEKGDIVVIIGGRSRQSRIFPVDSLTANEMSYLLDPDDGDRQEALAYLEDKDYDVGSAGSNSTSRPNATGTCRQYEQVLPATNPQTDAAEYQQRAENRGIETLTHEERRCVACRLLKKYDWKATWGWFQYQFGCTFKADVTHRQLRSVVDTYPEDYTHLEVPPQPS